MTLIGPTGAGKSTTANSICGQQKFKESCSTDSETDSVTALLATWQGVKGEEPVIAIDTPGLGDSKGRDTGHIAKMVCSLKQIGYVNAFLIILNSEEHRLSEYLQSTIKIFC